MQLNNSIYPFIRELIPVSDLKASHCVSDILGIS